MADLVKFQNRQYSLDERRNDRMYAHRVYLRAPNLFGAFFVVLIGDVQHRRISFFVNLFQMFVKVRVRCESVSWQSW